MNPLSEPRIVAFAGDWHGNAGYAREAIQHAAKLGTEVVLHLGDFGWRFAPSYLHSVDQALAATGLLLLFVDGNHEDHDWLNAQPLDEHGLRPVAMRIWHLPRGTRWEWHGQRWLALGGAHSVDRPLRVPGASWWPGETLTAADVERAIAGGPADVMLCHDCPAGVDIPGLQPHQFLDREIAAGDRHRQVLRDIVDSVQPGELWHGHYHTRYSRHLELASRTCRVEGLDCDRGDVTQNIVAVGLGAGARIDTGGGGFEQRYGRWS